SLSLPDLIRGSYVVRTGNVADVDVDVVIEEDGRNNLPKPPETIAPSSATQGSIDYLIERFALLNGRLKYEDRQTHVSATLPVSSIRIAGDRLTRRHQVQLTAGAAGVTMRGRDILQGIQLDASANYDVSRQRAQIVTFNVTSPIGQIRADGVLALDPQAG